jgi:hypothetical protein
MIIRFICFGLLAAGIAMFPGTSLAQTDDDKRPTFEIIAFGGMPGMYGKVDTNDGESTLPIDTSDATEEKNFAALAMLKLNFGDLNIRGSGEYFDLDGDRELAFVRVGPSPAATTQANTRPKAELWLADLSLGYRLVHAEDTVLEPAFEMYAGARYYNFKPDIGFRQGGAPVGRIDRNDAWVDGIVGARLDLALSETVNMLIEGDVGGFSIGKSSDFAWMQMTSLGWSFTDFTRLYLAYKFQEFDRDQGETQYREQFRGPYAGLSVMF